MKQLFTRRIFTLLVLITIMFSAKAQEISALYLVGDVVSSGWNIGDPTPMVQDTENALLFTWQGVLKAGELKISTFTGDWCDGQWLNAAEADQPIANATYLITNGCDGPDNKWRVSDEEAGVYLITIDLTAQTILFSLVSSEVADASLLSITLSAGELNPAFDSAVKKYTVNLPEGTLSVEVDAFPSDSEASISGIGEVDLTEGDTSIEIIVLGTDGMATEKYTISFVLVLEGEVYSNLYLVGDASPAGWNIGSPEPMIQDANNPLLFSWNGHLNAGEFKISAFSGDWCDGDWLLALEPDMPVNQGDYAYTVYSGCAPGEQDFKWRVQPDETGEYQITVDLENETIAISLTTGIEDFTQQFGIVLYPNPANGQVNIITDEEIAKVDIFDLTGKIVAQFHEKNPIRQINISAIKPGMYILKAQTNKGQYTINKLSVKQ